MPRPTLSLSPAADEAGGLPWWWARRSLAVQDVLEVPEVHQAQSSKKVQFGGDGQLVSSSPSFSGVISWGLRPESSFQNTTSVHTLGSTAVLKKLNWATLQTLTPFGLERGFPEEHPSSGFTAGRKDVKIANKGAVENHAALEVHIRQ